MTGRRNSTGAQAPGPTRAPARTVLNVHLREVAAPADRVGDLLDRLGGPSDRLWPSPAWWPVRFSGMDGDRLAVGARGGHGPIRYHVEEYERGRRVRCRFAPQVGLDGWHELRVDPVAAASADAPRCRLTHVISARLATPRTRVLWPLVIRRMHDALLEDLLDRAELLTTGRVARPARWSRSVRFVHAVLWPGPEAIPLPQPAGEPPVASERTDLAGACRVEFRPGMPVSPEAWADAVRRDLPRWARGSGGDGSHLDVGVHVRSDGDALIATTTARAHDRLGRVVLGLVRPVRPLVIRLVLRRVSRRLARQAPPPGDTR